MPQRNGHVVGRVRDEAETYRRGEDRPLGGYVLVMAVFAGLMAGAAGLVAARGRRLPELGPLVLLLLAADTDKLSRLLAKDAVTSPIRFGPTSPELHKRSEVDLHYRANPERI